MNQPSQFQALNLILEVVPESARDCHPPGACQKEVWLQRCFLSLPMGAHSSPSKPCPNPCSLNIGSRCFGGFLWRPAAFRLRAIGLQKCQKPHWLDRFLMPKSPNRWHPYAETYIVEWEMGSNVHISPETFASRSGYWWLMHDNACQ